MDMAKGIEISTKRLDLRPISSEDAEALYKYRSDAKTNKYQGWIPDKLSDVYDFLRDRVSSEVNLYGTWFQMVIIKKDTQELIGDVGIHFLDSDKKQAEIGCTLDKNHQGNGYATEALRETINYLFYSLDKRRIVTSIDPRNKSSIKLMERLGFRKEGHFRESIFLNGQWLDDLVYAMLKDEWRKLNE